MLTITHCLRAIKYKARIPVEGPTLIGVCDTFGILKEGQVYVKLQGKRGELRPALVGRVVVTRRYRSLPLGLYSIFTSELYSPIIHPGDIQVSALPE